MESLQAGLACLVVGIAAATSPPCVTSGNADLMLTRANLLNPESYHLDQLQTLGCDYRDELTRLLGSTRPQGRAAAAQGLGYCGDEASLASLGALLRHGDPDNTVLIAAAEALGDAHDLPSRPLLDSLVAVASEDYVREFVSRAAERVASPHCDVTLIQWGYYRMRLRFVLDDVASIAIANDKRQSTRLFRPAECDTIICLFGRGAATYIDAIPLGDRLILTLHDGRSMELLMDGANFVGNDTSHYFHKWVFWMKNAQLADYLGKIRGSE